ncbi:MAG: cell division protein FtsZ [Prevotella sp.]|nr:cell division protein FtsZ [Prevotella sp.]
MAKDKKHTNIEPLVEFDVPVEDRSQNIIKVIGVGGGGCNAVSNMYEEGIVGVTFAACNTDSKQLSKSKVPVKLLLGQTGLGCGAKPELGREEAESSLEQIEHLLNDGTQMVFVTAGMGGGTGTGAAPVVAGVAKKMGLLTVGVVTIPFYFEKKRKIIKALRGVDELRKNVDALLIVNNERLCDVYGDSDISMKEAFKRADNILTEGVKGISELITVHSDGGIDLDFRDVETTVRNGGGAIMAMGRARGEHRVEKAIMDALDSPLLYGNDIGEAKRILFNIYASDDAPIFVREMQEIDDFFDILDPNIDVIWGTSTDNQLGEDVKVTILATGMEDDIRNEQRPHTKDDGDDDFYEELIPKLYKPVKKAQRQLHPHEEEKIEETTEIEKPEPTEVEVTVKIGGSDPEEPEPQPIEDIEEETEEKVEEKPEETIEAPRKADNEEKNDQKVKPAQHHILDKMRGWLKEKTSIILDVEE